MTPYERSLLATAALMLAMMVANAARRNWIAEAVTLLGAVAALTLWVLLGG